jgi:hypothetical protein
MGISDVADNTAAVHTGHTHIGYDKIESLFFKLRNSFRAIFCGINTKPEAIQGLRKDC